jgi:hypothetical protein
VAGLVAALLGGLVGCSSDDEGRAQGQDGDVDDSVASAEGESGELSVLAYNVAGLPQEVSQEQPTEHIPLISPLLADFDVVLTQEDFDWWTSGLDGFDFAQYHEQLRADAGFAHGTVQHPGPEAVGIDPAERPLLNVGDGIGILSDLPFTDEVVVPWEGCFGGVTGPGAADCLAMKGFRVVTVQLADGAEVDVYSLHAEAGGGPEDQALQVDDFVQLADFVEEHSAGRAVILGGDTNLHTETEHEDSADGADIVIWDDFLAATGLTDACTATGCDDETRIDKIAYRNGGGVELEATSHEFLAEQFVDADGEALSDHEPLAVDFTWRRTG